MGKRFIVALDSSTEEQNEAFQAFIKENNLGWWHWLEGFWLLVDPQEKFGASEIIDVLIETYSDVHCLVIELSDSGDTWFGFGPKSKERNMFNWLSDPWDKYKK